MGERSPVASLCAMRVIRKNKRRRKNTFSCFSNKKKKFFSSSSRVCDIGLHEFGEGKVRLGDMRKKKTKKKKKSEKLVKMILSLAYLVTTKKKRGI